MVQSVLAHEAPGTVDVHFLCGPELKRGHTEPFEAMVRAAGAQISIHRVPPEELRGLPTSSRFSAAIWHRLFLPALLPAHDRILYLDADTLAVQSLAPLFELDLDGHHVAAVTNVPEQHMLGHAQSLGLAAPEAYFNSGVLLMNLDLMRRDGSTDALCAHAREKGESLLWPDQDTLNVVVGQTRKALHPKWNRMNSLDFPWSSELLGAREIQEARASPGVLHFEGPAQNKPWHLLAPEGARERYATYRRATPWPRFRRQGITPVNVGRWAVRAVRRAG